jgi:hypothetical protein
LGRNAQGNCNREDFHIHGGNSSSTTAVLASHQYTLVPNPRQRVPYRRRSSGGTTHASRPGMRRLAALVGCSTLLLIARPAECAQGARLSPGARIRFDAASYGYQMTGTLVRWEVDTLVVQVDGDAPGLALIVPADSLSRLDVRHERTMAAEGALLGGLAGTLLAVVASPDVLDENGKCTTLECLAYQVSPRVDTRIGVLAGVGFLVGIIVGSETKHVTWSSLPLQRVTVGSTPNGGLAMGVRISF